VRCGYCRRGVPDEALICPFCGFELAWAPEPPEPPTAVQADAKGDSPGLLWYMGLALLASALFSAIVALGLLGAEQGLNVRRERSGLLGEEYYQRGLVHLEQGNYLLAMAEFEEAVRLAPDHRDAQEQLGSLQTFLGVESVGSSGASSQALLSLFGEASALHGHGDWAEAIRRLEELRSIDPDYRGTQVGEMLLDSYHKQGEALLEAGELEQSLSVLNKALELDPDDPDVAELQRWLSLYMDGLAHWEVDWEGAVDSLRQLFELNPSFMDVQARLHDALLKLGDSYDEEGAWCVAESRYEEALRVVPSDAARDRRDRARELCLRAIEEATPSTPASAGTTQVITPALTAASSPIVEGFAGELLGYIETDATEMRVRVCVLDSRGRGVPGTGVELSAQEWRSDAIVTEADGCCRFAGLTEELAFEVGLTDLPCVPLVIATKWGTETQVKFVER
jgi:tetratricopeptide (TPR) repeat protein